MYDQTVWLSHFIVEHLHIISLIDISYHKLTAVTISQNVWVDFLLRKYMLDFVHLGSNKLWLGFFYKLLFNLKWWVV